MDRWAVVLLSLGAALAFAESATLKHLSAGRVPDAQSLHPGKLARFVRATVTHRLWIAGIGCDTIGLGLQLLALHLGALALVQPLLITGLLFTLLLRRGHDRGHVSLAQLAWAGVLTAALAGFVVLVEASGSPPAGQVDRLPAVIAALVGVLLAGGSVELGRRLSSRGYSAALLGVAVGLVYAGEAALLKSITDIAVRDVVRVLSSWQLYVAIALGATGLLLNQLAFQAGPIAASLPATATVDPLTSIVIGVSVYDEPLRSFPGSGVVLVALLLVLGLSVIALARRSPRATEPG